MKQTTKTYNRKTNTRSRNPFNATFGLVILAYIIIPTFTPNMMAFDTNAPKFLALALVNLAGFIFLLSSKQVRQNPASMGYFFKTWIGIAYAGFLLISLLSFINALSLSESIMQFTKIFTVFSAVYIISVILIKDLRFLKFVVLVFTALLIFDSLSVFYYINEFIRGRLDNIYDIKTIYSNKNILASSVFVKLPFAIWLLLYGNSWQKKIGCFGLFTGITATFFMATRAFYLGLIILTTAFLAYALIAYLRSKQNRYIQLAGAYLIALVMAYLAFTSTQRFLYPQEDKSRYTAGIERQLASIGAFDTSASQRIDFWKWSWKMLREKPVLGVGCGNWKIVVLKYENQQKHDFKYAYKAHNDFIETAAETGFIGGLLYLAIFVLMARLFFRKILTAWNDQDNMFRYLFLATAGIAFYSVDATFNCPADRPEILVLFSFFLASGITVAHHSRKTDIREPNKIKHVNLNSKLNLTIIALILVALVSSAYILFINFESSRLQRKAWEEIDSGKLISPYDRVMAGFPGIPAVSEWGEPINTIKARYLLNERRYEAAIALLRSDRSSPWDSRREYFMSMAFDNLNLPDSTLRYAQLAVKLKPKNFKHVAVAANYFMKAGYENKAIAYVNSYLTGNKKNSVAWVFGCNLYISLNKTDSAWKIIEEARKYLPGDSLVNLQHSRLYYLKFIEPYIEQYEMASEYYNKQDYFKALNAINQFINKVPDYFPARRLRSFLYYYLNDFQKCIPEIDYAIALSDDTGALYNLRGVCYRALNDMASACRDFEKSMLMGNQDGIINFNKFCQPM